MTDWSKARRHLSRVDPVMKQIIRRVGPCTLAPRRDYFVTIPSGPRLAYLMV